MKNHPFHACFFLEDMRGVGEWGHLFPVSGNKTCSSHQVLESRRLVGHFPLRQNHGKTFHRDEKQDEALSCQLGLEWSIMISALIQKIDLKYQPPLSVYVLLPRKTVWLLYHTSQKKKEG